MSAIFLFLDVDLFDLTCSLAFPFGWRGLAGGLCDARQREADGLCGRPLGTLGGWMRLSWRRLAQAGQTGEAV
jgi:hypothetical protein